MKVFVVIILLISCVIIVFGINLKRKETLENSANYEIPRNDNGWEILSETTQYYHSFNSYKSRGITEYVETNNGKESRVTQTQFDLSYQHPKNINLSWKEEENDKFHTLKIDSSHSILEKNGKVSKEYERINDAVFDASFENGNSRFFILSLLAFNDKFLSPLKKVQRLDDESINGEIHYKIRADLRGVATDAKVNFIYWIERKSLIIKKIQREITYEGITKRTTEIYSDVETNFLQKTK